jgi:hypothetical protein
MPEGAQWEESGQYYKIEDGQKCIWYNVLGWVGITAEGQ